MDQISYTWGAMVELNQKFWAFRAGYFLVPVVSNTDEFDMNFPNGEYIGELELRYSLFSQPGKLRLMAWVNRANMGSYAAALAEPITTPNYPDITLRSPGADQLRVRRQSRAGDHRRSRRVLARELEPRSRRNHRLDRLRRKPLRRRPIEGDILGRPNDRIGVAGVINGLSPEARAYFAAGGLGILIGDGALNYRPEKIIETYYSYSLNTWSALPSTISSSPTLPITLTGDRSIFLPGGFTWSFERPLIVDGDVAGATRLAISGDLASRGERVCAMETCENVFARMSLSQ